MSSARNTNTLDNHNDGELEAIGYPPEIIENANDDEVPTEDRVKKLGKLAKYFFVGGCLLSFLVSAVGFGLYQTFPSSGEILMYLGSGIIGLSVLTAGVLMNKARSEEKRLNEYSTNNEIRMQTPVRPMDSPYNKEYSTEFKDNKNSFDSNTNIWQEKKDENCNKPLGKPFPIVPHPSMKKYEKPNENNDEKVNTKQSEKK